MFVEPFKPVFLLFVCLHVSSILTMSLTFIPEDILVDDEQMEKGKLV